MAESVRFELTVGFPITSFQDWLLKPLGQLSICKESYHFRKELSRLTYLSALYGQKSVYTDKIIGINKKVIENIK